MLCTVRVLLIVASIKKWNLHHINIDNYFLHGYLDKDVYMSVPQRIKCTKANQVASLLKVFIFWNKQEGNGMINLASETWLYSIKFILFHVPLSKYDKIIFLLVHVDDVTLAVTSLSEFDMIKGILHRNFKIKDIVILKYFLSL